MTTLTHKSDANHLSDRIKQWGIELGFQQVGISHGHLTDAENRLKEWLDHGYQGEMDYMSKHGNKRSRPAELVPGTVSIISVRMDYLPAQFFSSHALLENPTNAFISRYALGRDYHKVMRHRLQKLADIINHEIGSFHYRAFADSAPVLEKAIAEQAGLGWIGKHSNLIHRHAGSWFFLGELYTNLELIADPPSTAHCGNCTACMTICPTQAIVSPFVVDARRCISYLTIEYKGSIPLEFRPLMGNRIYGCDDCQLICPWNRFAKPSSEADFFPRHNLDNPALIALFKWTETEFLNQTEGSAIRRIGYSQWLRNLAIAIGNGPADPEVISTLAQKIPFTSELVQEHIYWALENLNKKHPDTQ